MHRLLFAILLFFSGIVLGQESAPNPSIRAELEAMLETDQSHRRELIELEKRYGRDSTQVQETWSKQSAIDAVNIRRLEELIAQQGWPGRTHFGDKAATAAFLILQHSDLSYQKKYLPLARDAAATGEMEASQLALLEDRVRMREGQKQIYGSQVTRNSADEWEPFPLEDEENVDALRAGVGLPPLSEYLQGFASRSGGRVHPKWTKSVTSDKALLDAARKSQPVSMDALVVKDDVGMNFGFGLRILKSTVTKTVLSMHVDSVDEHSDAAQQGLLVGDEIKAIDGQPVAEMEASFRPGTPLRALLVGRKKGDTIKLTVTSFGSPAVRQLTISNGDARPQLRFEDQRNPSTPEENLFRTRVH